MSAGEALGYVVVDLGGNVFGVDDDGGVLRFTDQRDAEPIADDETVCALVTLADYEAVRAAVAEAARVRSRVEALRDEWEREPDTGGACPDGLCGACTLGVASERLTTALAAPDADQASGAGDE